MIDPIDVKYFKLAVGKLAKETPNDCSVNCVSCGDRKQRLHLYKNDGMDIALVHCYNAGCIFDDNQMGMVKFLKEVRPELVPNYKKERFADNIKNIKKDNELSLDDILAVAEAKKAGKEPPNPQKPTKSSNIQEDIDIDIGGLFSNVDKSADTKDNYAKPLKEDKKPSSMSFDFNFTNSDFEFESQENTNKNVLESPKNKETTIKPICDDEDLEAELVGIKKQVKPETDLPDGSTALRIPELFSKKLLPCRNVPEAVEYIEKRGLSVGDNWLFSRDKFINIFDKAYYVKNFIFIPIFQYKKLKGFYTRSIEEKRFSTIIFPKGEKYWASETLDPTQTVYVFEGIFDAMSSGYENVIAMLSADLPESLLSELKDPVFCFDNDETGVRKAIKYNKMGYKTFVWREDIKEKDMNERLLSTSLEENKKLIAENIYSGLEAYIRLNRFVLENPIEKLKKKTISIKDYERY